MKKNLEVDLKKVCIGYFCYQRPYPPIALARAKKAEKDEGQMGGNVVRDAISYIS